VVDQAARDDGRRGDGAAEQDGAGGGAVADVDAGAEDDQFAIQVQEVGAAESTRAVDDVLDEPGAGFGAVGAPEVVAVGAFGGGEVRDVADGNAADRAGAGGGERGVDVLYLMRDLSEARMGREAGGEHERERGVLHFIPPMFGGSSAAV